MLQEMLKYAKIKWQNTTDIYWGYQVLGRQKLNRTFGLIYFTLYQTLPDITTLAYTKRKLPLTT